MEEPRHGSTHPQDAQQWHPGRGTHASAGVSDIMICMIEFVTEIEDNSNMSIAIYLNNGPMKDASIHLQNYYG